MYNTDEPSIRSEVNAMFAELTGGEITLSHTPLTDPSEPRDFLSSRLTCLTDDQNFHEPQYAT